MSDIVEVEVAGQSYRIRSDEGNADLQEVARFVNGRIAAIKEAAPDLAAERVAILAALNMGDELLRQQAAQDAASGEVEVAVAAVRERLTELVKQVEEAGAAAD